MLVHMHTCLCSSQPQSHVFTASDMYSQMLRPGGVFFGVAPDADAILHALGEAEGGPSRQLRCGVVRVMAGRAGSSGGRVGVRVC